MMSIDEAIAHAREEAKMKMAEYENHYDKDGHYYPRQCKRYAEQQEQLAEWLEELKAYRQYIDLTEIPEQYKLGFQDGIIAGYNNAIDDFAEKLKRENKETIPTHSGYCRMNFDEVVDEIAEQLREGVENGKLSV